MKKVRVNIKTQKLHLTTLIHISYTNRKIGGKGGG